ncbi:hypothetical protein TNCV_102731 [Trichonephila clavipes]|nr:hypothetical protein TNCV_102731 [Trichonephila clavipes]
MAKGEVTPVVSRSSLSIMQVTVRVGSFPPHFGGWSGVSHLSSPSTNHARGLAARRLFRVPPCREGTIHLQTPMSSPGFESRSYGIAVSVANHYTGWATPFNINISSATIREPLLPQNASLGEYGFHAPEVP